MKGRNKKFALLNYFAATGFFTSIGATNFWCTAKATITITSVIAPFFKLSVDNMIFCFKFGIKNIEI
jgi:hypothetical protein